MPGEGPMRLAHYAGQAVAAAAATDEWESVRGRFARLLGHGDVRKTQVAEGWLAQTREELAAAEPGAVGQARQAAAELWAGWFADLLDDYPSAVDDLRALVEEVTARLTGGSVVVTGHSNAVGITGDSRIVGIDGDMNTTGGSVRRTDPTPQSGPARDRRSDHGPRRQAGGTANGDKEPRSRFLTGIAPERAPAGVRISLQVQVALAAGQGASAALKTFPVGPAGAVVTITVSAPGLIPLGDLEQDLTVPFAADSEPVRFGFRTGPVGLHSVQVRAFAGGTCLGELMLEISVETGAALEEGRPRSAPLPDLAAEPGEVTLQVSRTAGGGYSFQLLSGTLDRAVIIDRLAGDPGQVIGQLIAELRAM